MKELTEETLYLFQNISLKNYYGSKLTTTKSIAISDEGGVPYTLPQDAINNCIILDKKLNNPLHSKLCFPEVVAVTLDVFSGCTNKACGKLVAVVTPYEATVKTCKCPCVFHCTASFEEYEHPLNLPLEVLPMFLGKDVIKMCKENLKSVKKTLLFLENIDYVYNTKNVITSIKKH